MPSSILVVEDYEDARRLMKLALEKSGYRVVEAIDGHEAVACAANETFNLILMDMALPGMDGLAATREIKKMENSSNVPIIGITAHGNLFSQQAIEAGCEATVTKPVDMQALNTIVSLYISP